MARNTKGTRKGNSKKNAKAARPEAPTADVYERVTARIITELEKGAAPWLKPWSDSKAGRCGGSIIPRNVISGHHYSGINIVLAWGHMDGLGVMNQEPLFLTYRQAQEAGGNVRKGEKGCLVVAFKQGVMTKDGQPVIGDDGQAKVYWKAFGNTVFHVSQCDGLTLPEVALIEAPRGLVDGSFQAWLAMTGADVRHGGTRAFYTPTYDYVQMPTAPSFKSEEHYKATVLHEMTHWTGHKKRLERDFSGRFGNDAYAFEELVAELGAAFLCAELGVDNPDLRHAGYIDHWLKVLREDKRAIFKAASLAGKAAKYIGELVDGAETRAKPECRALVPYKAPGLPVPYVPLAVAA